MYEDFYGLNERPFSLTPDTEFLFLNQHYQDALDHLLYAVKRQEGFTVVLGDIGTGKTTLCWALLERLESNIQTALILNTSLNQEDILRAILQDLGVVRQTQPSSGSEIEKKGGTDLDSGWMERLTKKELLDEFNSYVKQNAEQKIFTVIVIDESQNLTLDTLELLRMLSNLETAKRKLLQIIFVGQLEFEKKLNSLRQLNQRISTRFTLKPLSKEDTTEYIHHRLRVAGAIRRPLFEKRSLGKIYKYSNGYPRLVNLICDRALLAGASQGADRITSKMVMQAVRNLRGAEDFSGRHLLQSLKKALPVVAPLILLLLGLLVFLTNREIVPSNFFSRRPAPLSLPQNQPGTTETAGVVAVKTDPAIGARALVENKKDASKPSQPTTQRPITVTRSRYALQVHSFNTRERAETALAELERTGYPVFIQVDENGPRKWFSVCVGPFAELEIARENAAILAMRERTSAIIRKFSVVEH